jgi:two-component system, LytTR family, sensor histidine kinase AlgZ
MSKDPDGAADSRPASLWPDSTRVSEYSTMQFEVSRFGAIDAARRSEKRQRLSATAAFDVCHPALALRALLFVQAVGAVLALADSATLVDWAQRQAALALGGLAATLLWLVLVCAAKGRLQRQGGAMRAALVVGLGAVLAFGVLQALVWLGLAGGSGGGDAPVFQGLAVAFGGAGVAGLMWIWLELRARAGRPADAHARLAELQSRIRPHFLFNALNTALAMVRVAPDRAEAVLEDLAQLFRTALAESGASVPLAEEIALARRYLAIEQVRFGNRLVVHWEIDPKVANARVPPLVLQPLVENAVRHGVEPNAQGGELWIRARVRAGQVDLRVSNTVGERTGPPGLGMALPNVRERLRLLHDLAGQCDIQREPGQFHVRLLVPMP